MMMIRVYKQFDGTYGDAVQDNAFQSDEEMILSMIAQWYTRELLAFRQQMAESFPDAVLKRERAFRSEPLYLSFTLSFSLEGERHSIIALLEEMEVSGRIAAWEDCEQEKYPSLCFLLEKQPRKETLPRDVRGYVFLRAIGPLYYYHARLLPEEIPDLSLRGMNASTGQRFVSQTEKHNVLTLDFALDLGQRLLLWCSQGNEKTVVATAMMRQMSHLIIEKEEGLSLQRQNTRLGGVSLSP